MSRVRLTGPYRYLIYVTPDNAIVEGMDLGTGQEAIRISRHSDPLVLEKYSMVTTNNKGNESKMLVRINDMLCITYSHCCRKKSGRKQVESKERAGDNRSHSGALGRGPCPPAVAKAEDHLTFQTACYNCR